MSGGTCREQSSTDASDSSMCGSNGASRPERASSSSRKISRGKGNFPLASILAADKSRSHSFYSSVTRNRLRSANQEQQIAGRKERYRNQKTSTIVIPATIDRVLDPSKRPPTGGWTMRISDCPHSIEQTAFRENAYLEWMTCLLCGARWS